MVMGSGRQHSVASAAAWLAHLKGMMCLVGQSQPRRGGTGWELNDKEAA